jgi:hypothetical protein
MDNTSFAGIQAARDERIIADLSQSFSVPSSKVQAIYREQLRRLAEGARIQSFLSVLAMGKTRSILRNDTVMKPPKLVLPPNC